MIAFIQTVLAAITGFFMSYLAFLSLLAWWERNSKRTIAAPSREFVIVVPAYNEEDCIARTLRNLRKVNYPNDKYDIVVIADNCTDRTAEIARSEGALVMERDHPEKRGKGYALRWCFDRLTDCPSHHPYAAAVVVDADTVVTRNLLCVMNKYMEEGAEVVQGYLTVDSKPDVWTSEIIRIGFTLYNYVRPLARRAMGYPAGLRGNGMCFSIDVLDRVPWDAYSLTEDLEYGLKLLLEDVNIVFAPEAIGYNVVPEKASNAKSQRERWEMGRFPVLWKYSGRLFKEAVRRRSFKILDTLIDLVTPPLVNMVGFCLLMALLNLAAWGGGLQASLGYFWTWTAIIGLGFMHALLGLQAAGADRATYRSLIYVPRYALWKIGLYFRILVLEGPTSEWVRTSRESN